MYTYTLTFFGVPLSQTDDAGYEDDFKLMLQGLTDLARLDKVVAMDAQEYIHDFDPSQEDEEIFLMFLEWVKKNQDALKELDFAFIRSYHGSNEYPMIFGHYGGLSLPDGECRQIDTSIFIEIVEKEKIVQKLFATLPVQVSQRFPALARAGFWANDHSS